MVSHYTLTKKTFLAGAQCLKRMWWEMYDPSALETRPTPTARFRMEEGAKVGVIARTYVPGGRLIKRGGRSLNAILADTREAIADQSVPAIYEAAVLANDTLVFPDILERRADGFVLIEVKSKTSVSELKHIPDVAIQAHVLRAAGIPIVRCEVMHLNRDCVYPDLSNLFSRIDVTELVEARLETIAEEMRVEMITARPENVSTLDDYLRIMHTWTEKIQSSPMAIERSVYEVIGKEFRGSRVTQIELRFNPMKRNLNSELDLDHIIHAALRGMDRACLLYTSPSPRD